MFFQEGGMRFCLLYEGFYFNLLFESCQIFQIMTAIISIDVPVVQNRLFNELDTNVDENSSN